MLSVEPKKNTHSPLNAITGPEPPASFSASDLVRHGVSAVRADGTIVASKYDDDDEIPS